MQKVTQRVFLPVRMVLEEGMGQQLEHGLGGGMEVMVM